MTNTTRLGEAAGSGLLLFIILMLLGSPLVYRGWQIREAYQDLTALPFIRSTTISDGEQVKVSGQVKDSNEKITSPVQSTQCEMAFWKVATLRRYDIFNHMSRWSAAGIGIDTESLVIMDETREIKISDINREKTLSVTDEVGYSLGSSKNSILDSIARALDPPDFENRQFPNERLSKEYDELRDRIDLEATTTNSSGLFVRIINAIRIPQDTVQFQETVITAGDTITAVGEAVGGENDRVRLQGTGSVGPIISLSTPSKLEREYRRTYMIQLYGIPLFITVLSSIAGVGVLL